MPFIPYYRVSGLLAAFVASIGCASGSTRHATSVVNYLYPDRSEVADQPTVPVLNLPLRVGIAFVPEETERGGATESFPEAERVRLMNEVATHFRQYPFVKTIEIIPTAYLAPRGGFPNLDQLRNMFAVDVITLISYDQVQFTDEGRSTLTYLTVIGAYLVEGEKHDTRTLMDAVVYDIKSRKLLFRAPGVSAVKGSSTPVNLSEEKRRNSEKGFQLASRDLVTNLDSQLQLFRERVKSAPEEFQVVRQPSAGSGSGGGSTDAWFAALLLSVAGYGVWSRRRQAR
jgi:rhombotail lipoprotein